MRVAPVGQRSPRGTHKEYFSSLRDDEPCLTCGVIMAEHLRCRACCILVGPGHETAHGGLCFTCERQAQTEEGEQLVREAIRRDGLCG